MTTRIAFLISRGRGQTLNSLLAHLEGAALVVASHEDAPGLDRARVYGVEALVIQWKKDKSLGWGSRTLAEERLDALLRARSINLICLVGFMYILSANFVADWKGKILNLHPALLPAFAGKDPQAQALARGVKVTGTTVHFVTEGVNTGPIVAQKAVPVLEDDTLESLSGMLRKAGVEIYVQAIQSFADGSLKEKP